MHQSQNHYADKKKKQQNRQKQSKLCMIPFLGNSRTKAIYIERNHTNIWGLRGGLTRKFSEIRMIEMSSILY